MLTCAILVNLKHVEREDPQEDKCMFPLIEGPQEGQIHIWRESLWLGLRDGTWSSYLVDTGFTLG